MIKNIFLSSTKPYGLYDFIISASKLSAEKSTKQHLKLEFIDKKKITFSFLKFFIFFLLSGSLFNWGRVIKLKYKDCDIGRFSIAKSFRDVSSYKNILYLYYNLIKNLFFSGLLVDTAIILKDNVKAVYIDHIGYLNGALFSIFSKYKIRVYTNAYPRSIFYIDYKKKNNYFLNSIENALKIRPSRKKIIPSKAQIFFYENILKKPNLIPYMKYAKFIKINNYKNVNWKSYNCIIYTHSFLDAQLWYGDDGFKNLYDWLLFTIQELLNRNYKIIIKAHPNFYNSAIGETADIDKKIFNKIKKKFNDKNIFYIDEPVKNFDLLKKVSKKTLLISHHGSALIEGMYLGFKCISSSSTFWSHEFLLTNQWNSQDEYKNILSRKWKDLIYSNKDHLNDLLYNVFWKKGSIYGKQYYVETISRVSRISRELMFKLQHEIKVKKETRDRIINQLEKNIEEVKL